MPTNLSKTDLATILSTLDGQPRNPANRDKALAAIGGRAAKLGLTTDEILDAAPGLLDGRLSPADWLAEITEDARTKVETITAEGVAAVKAGSAERAAEPEAQPLPKLTRGERQLLVNIARNLMTPVNGAEPATLDEAGSVWRNCLDQGPETIKPASLPGLVASLTKKGLASSNGESVGLTALGFAAYRSLAAEAPAAENAIAETKPQIREGTKQATLIAMLRRPEGADLDEIAEATGWQKHTIRGAISGALKKKLGLEVTSTKDHQNRRVYRLTTSPADVEE
jgi:hypothetical protein